jgi:transposase-like protein
VRATLPGAAWQRCRTHYAATLMSATPNVVLAEQHDEWTEQRRYASAGAALVGQAGMTSKRRSSQRMNLAIPPMTG